MNYGDLFHKNSNKEEEKYLQKIYENSQFKEEFAQKYIEDYLSNLLKEFEEKIDKLDSYERAIEIKRSIDRLIETLYSKASLEDIETELETTKHTSEKLDSMKRINEKRRKRLYEQMLSHIFSQENTNKINSTNVDHIETDLHEVKEQVKFSVKEVLFSVIAHKMDPRRRAGETADDNEKNAHMYGREAKRGLLKTIFAAISTILNEVITKHNKNDTSFAKQVIDGRKNADLYDKTR